MGKKIFILVSFFLMYLFSFNKIYAAVSASISATREGGGASTVFYVGSRINVDVTVFEPGNTQWKIVARKSDSNTAFYFCEPSSLDALPLVLYNSNYIATKSCYWNVPVSADTGNYIFEVRAYNSTGSVLNNPLQITINPVCGDRDQACCATGTCNTGMACAQRSPAAPVCCPTGSTINAGSGLCVTPLPVISNITDTALTSVRVKVEWDTNVPTTSYVAYDIVNTSFGATDPALWGAWRYNIDNVLATDMKTHHIMEIGGLTPNTTYYYRVAGRDVPQAGQQAVMTGVGTVATLAGSTPTPTATTVPCGTVLGGACCATSPKCTVNATTSTFLYCLSNACQSFNSIIIGASSWYNAFTSYYASFDFDNNDRVGGLDYALWLKAGNHL